jgi:arginyl-tRNA synthetase
MTGSDQMKSDKSDKSDEKGGIAQNKSELVNKQSLQAGTLQRISELDPPAQPTNQLISQSANSLEPKERELLRQMEYFEPITEMAAKDLQPSLITSYLINLSKAFNQFYEKCPILGSGKTDFRLLLAKRAGERIQLGLYLLGIETVEKM